MSEYSRGPLYRVYLNEEWDLAPIYGFRQTAEDGRRFHTRYLNEAGMAGYIAEMWILGITELEFEEIDEDSVSKL